MRICFLTPQYSLDTGGISTYVRNLARGLAERGHSVSIVTRQVRSIIGYATDEGIPIYRTPHLALPPAHLFAHGFFSMKVLKEWKPDIVHVSQPGSFLLGDLGTPVVTTFHTTIDQEKAAFSCRSLYGLYVNCMWPVIKLIEEDTIKKSGKIVAVSQETLKTLVGVHPRCVGKIEVIYNALPREWFHIERRERGNILLFVGRLSEIKGLEYLIEAMPMVKRDFPDVGLLLVGDGELRGKLERKVRDLRLKETVAFKGDLDESMLLPLYSVATALVLPSLYENCPFSLLQAFASGAPVIATQIGGVSELIDDGETGLLTPPRDSYGLASAISKMLVDAQLRSRISHRAKEFACKNLQLERAVDRLERIYFDLANKS